MARAVNFFPYRGIGDPSQNTFTAAARPGTYWRETRDVPPPARRPSRRTARQWSFSLWHSPGLMNLLAIVLAAVGTVSLAFNLWMQLSHMPVALFKSIHISTPLQRVRSEEIVAQIRRSLRGNFFGALLEPVQATLDEIPWARKSTVRRHWPPGLTVSIEEHEVLARWGEAAAPDDTKDAPGASVSNVAAYVNSYGEVFSAELHKEQAQALPLFSGPDGTASRVLERYGVLRKKLGPLGLEPEALTLSQRLSWRVLLNNGTVLEFGRERPEQDFSARLKRLIRTYRYMVSLSETGRAPARVDLRYPDGLAVTF